MIILNKYNWQSLSKSMIQELIGCLSETNCLPDSPNKLIFLKFGRIFIASLNK